MKDRPYTILLVEDDEDDYLLFSEAIAETNITHEVIWVRDGEAVMQYISDEHRPDLIILDLNMPAVDGRDVLRQIKSDPLFLTIPVVVMTTSGADEDIDFCYSMGANSYIKKPDSFSNLLNTVKLIGSYWLDTVELPRGKYVNEGV
ncbi:chemotaxis protein CheY [Candidatus Magnetobacterium bavaricum]|uniref:Chemotaxis protein CheY n=1 Tax=Candidatus Magnetobacterium bavaricum TaxID=29290 RepID=A0A0F3H243_9BACT|nr:chemotaxis protein CheY [Candidatus Magnetobacterium bavaricum]